MIMMIETIVMKLMVMMTKATIRIILTMIRMISMLMIIVKARVWCRGRIDRKRNSTINLTTDSGACY